MRRILLTVSIACGAAAAGFALSPSLRQVRMSEVVLSDSESLPDDLVNPEGKSRWDLRSVALRDPWVQTTRAEGKVVVLENERPSAGTGSSVDAADTRTTGAGDAESDRDRPGPRSAERHGEPPDTRNQTGSTEGGISRFRYSDPSGGDAAARWLYPDQYGAMLRPGA